MPDLHYKVIVKEPLVVVMPSDHRLASQNAVAPQDIAGEIFIGMSNTAPTLQVVIDDYSEAIGPGVSEQRTRSTISAMAMSLIASTRGVALLPAYAKNFLPWSLTSRPLDGEAPYDRSCHRLQQDQRLAHSRTVPFSRRQAEEGPTNALTNRHCLLRRSDGTLSRSPRESGRSPFGQLWSFDRARPEGGTGPQRPLWWLAKGDDGNLVGDPFRKATGGFGKRSNGLSCRLHTA